MRKHQGDNGFTLVELLVVIVIVGVLTSIAVPSFAAQTRKAKVSAMKSSLRSAATIQEQRAVDQLPYATPGPAGLLQLVADGYVNDPAIELTVVSDDLPGGGFCLRAHHVSLPGAYDLFYANGGPTPGRPTKVSCG